MSPSAATEEDTICAVATACGEAALAIVRLSGPDAFKIVDRIFKSHSGDRIDQAKAFTVHYGHLVEKNGSLKTRVVDEVLVTVYRAPKTYTTQDMVEISCHGGSAVREEVMRLLSAHGARPAEPGEFTKRAFLGGRIDLAQAEAVQDVIQARGRAALKNATEQLSGALSQAIRSLRSDLLDQLVQLEAAIDFPDEDIELLDRKSTDKVLRSVRERIDPLLQGAALGRFLAEGVRTVLAGRPNVGKSSLLNRLVGVDRSIVTDIPGTTRDAIEEEVQIGGLRFRMSDTAGIGTSPDRVERIGIARAKKLIAQADIVLFIVDGSAPVTDADRSIAELVKTRKVIPVVNKCDLPLRAEGLEVLWDPVAPLRVSALDGTGMEALEDALLAAVPRDGLGEPEGSWVTNLRHRRALEAACKALERTRAALNGGEPPEIIAVDLKETLSALGEIIGETTTEDLLDRIFSQFCIGK